MKANKQWLWVFLLLVTACGSNRMSVAQFQQWMQEESNGLRKKKTVSDWVVEVQYKPVSFLKLKNPDQHYDGYQYFDIRLSTATSDLMSSNIQSREDYNQRLQYLMFEMEKDLKLVDGHDTLSCVLYHFERSYQVKPFHTIMTAFPVGKKLQGSKTLILESAELNTGPLKFDFASEKLTQVPQIY